MRIRPRESIVVWDVRVTGRDGRSKGACRASTFEGMLMPVEDTRRTRPDFVPTLSAAGEARRTVLALCDGHRTARRHRSRGLPPSCRSARHAGTGGGLRGRGDHPLCRLRRGRMSSAVWSCRATGDCRSCRRPPAGRPTGHSSCVSRARRSARRPAGFTAGGCPIGGSGCQSPAILRVTSCGSTGSPTSGWTCHRTGSTAGRLPGRPTAPSAICCSIR